MRWVLKSGDVMQETLVATGECRGWVRSILESKQSLWLVSLLTIIFFTIANLPWQLNEYSQERQALASFSIIKEGRWWYQLAPRDREATKPPFAPWISAGLFAVTRSWDFSWRFPSLVAAVWLIILLFRAATRAFGAAAGLLSLSAFSLNNLSPRMATLVRTDMPLALLAFLIGLLIWRKIREQTPWQQRDRWIIFTSVLIGLFLKGPIIYVFSLPGILAYQWWRRRNWDGANVRVPSAWCGWWPWLAPFGIFLIWVVAGILWEPGFYQQVVIHEFLGRFSTTEQGPHPPYYYVAHLMQKFAPWTELLIVLTALGLYSQRNSVRDSLRKISPATFWLICWSLAALILLSLIPSKRIDRIYPVIPSLCLLLAAQVNWGFARSDLRRKFSGWCAVALITSILLTGHYVFYKKVYLGYRSHRDALSTFGRDVRREAQARGWRYEIVESHDGGMLLYLEKTHFVQADRAVAEWNNGEINALVVRTQEGAELIKRLPSATISPIQTDALRADHGRGYIVIVRS